MVVWHNSLAITKTATEAQNFSIKIHKIDSGLLKTTRCFLVPPRVTTGLLIAGCVSTAVRVLEDIQSHNK
jgi:hypothetical protein